MTRLVTTLVVAAGWALLALLPTVEFAGGSPGQAGTLSGLMRVTTEVPTSARATLLVRSVAYGLIGLCSVLAGAIAMALAWRSSEPNDAAVRLITFLAPLPLALGLEYFLLPLDVLSPAAGYAGSALSAAAFAVSVVSLPLFAFSFPGRLSDEDLIDGFRAHSRPRLRGLRWMAGAEQQGGYERELRFVERHLSGGRFLGVVGALLIATRMVDDIWFGLLLLTSIGFALLYSWIVLDIQRRGPEGRRVVWILGGVWLAIASWVLLGTILFALGPIVGEVGWWAYLAGLMGIGPFVALSLLIGGCGLAALYSGDIDAALVVRRTTVTTAMAIVLLFGFGAVETVVTDLVFAALGLPQGVGAVLAGGTMAVAFKPIHDFVATRVPALAGDERASDERAP